MYSIYDYSVNYFIRNVSHIYACTHPNPKFMIWPKRPPLAFSVAEMSYIPSLHCLNINNKVHVVYSGCHWVVQGDQ